MQNITLNSYQHCYIPNITFFDNVNASIINDCNTNFYPTTEYNNMYFYFNYTNNLNYTTQCYCDSESEYLQVYPDTIYYNNNSFLHNYKINTLDSLFRSCYFSLNLSNVCNPQILLSTNYTVNPIQSSKTQISHSVKISINYIFIYFIFIVIYVLK